MTHGGERTGAGKPRTNLDERRLKVLLAEGLSQRAIGERFGVGRCVIQRMVKRMTEK